MASDANLTLQASVTKTASFNSTGVDLKVGTPRRGLNARFLYSAVTNASGSNSATLSVEHSSDNSTFYALSSAASAVINMSTTAQAGEIILPFITELRYVRAVLVVAGAGSTPTITYSVDIVNTHP